ncbi:hypothetical protein F5879DRAFT_1050704 [Lentinula edodes]|nr:hypothetical protein F5879DRAFT_1050704 [Lentinula edodes]
MDGLNLAGRSLCAQWADKKSKKGEQVKKKTKPIPPPRPSYPKATHDLLMICTIVISGISAEIDTKSFTRNIPFNTSQQDLHALFLPYSPIYSIHIPLETNTDDANVTNNGEEPSPKIKFSTKITIPNPRIHVCLDPITAEHPCVDALRVLLWANNNLSIAELWEEWWKEELVALLQAEKNKLENEKEESRIKRVEEEIEKLESGSGGSTVPKKSRGMLIVDFSIENADGTPKRDPKNATAQSEELAPRKKRKFDKVYKLKKDVKDKDLKDELREKVQARSERWFCQKRKEHRKGK